jgi:hypothetical protein
VHRRKSGRSNGFPLSAQCPKRCGYFSKIEF